MKTKSAQENYLVTSQNWKRLPYIFDRNDFDKMIKAVYHCSIYPIDQFQRSWMKARDTCIIAILYYMGLRPKEALSLRYDDFKAKEIAFLIRGELNHSNKDRIMPIPKEVIPFLENYLSFGKTSNIYIFPSFDNRARPLSSSRWKNIFREKCLQPAGLYIPAEKGAISRTRSYSLRASFATRLMQNSHSPELVAFTLGHNDWRTIKKYVLISHLTKEGLDNLRNLM